MKLTKENLAQLLNGRESGDEISEEEEALANASGLVVVFGYSDDNVELRGAIGEEIGAYCGTTFRVTASGIAPTWNDDHEKKNKADALAWFRSQNELCADIEAQWGIVKPYSWTFKTTIPHVCFDVMEDGRKFCRGIVFELAKLS